MSWPARSTPRWRRSPRRCSLRTAHRLRRGRARTRRSRACATASTSSSPARAGSPTTCSPATPTSARSRSPCSTRPTTWPTSASCPVVRRLLDKTPSDGQRMLFSATLDAGVDVLVKRFLHDPVTHSVDSAQSPVSKMTHHVLHVSKERPAAGARRPDRGAGQDDGLHPHQARRQGADPPAQRARRPGRRAARQPVARTPAPATSRRSPPAPRPTLVATDIAARGIHVDDVGLVVHADPPVEHKAYLHRSGRTARAGAEGTVVTLMTGRPGPRRPRPHPQGRHQADHHPHPARRRAAAPRSPPASGPTSGGAQAGSRPEAGAGPARSAGQRRRGGGNGGGGRRRGRAPRWPVAAAEEQHRRRRRAPSPARQRQRRSGSAARTARRRSPRRRRGSLSRRTNRWCAVPRDGTLCRT